MADARLGTGFINVNKIKSVHSEIKFTVLIKKKKKNLHGYNGVN